MESVIVYYYSKGVISSLLYLILNVVKIFNFQNV